jgi:hypothetical protein
MFYQSLMAGWSRGFTVMMQGGLDAARPAGGEVGPPALGASAATRGDLIAALRFPLAPGWILQGARRRVGEAMSPPVAAPRGCG